MLLTVASWLMGSKVGRWLIGASIFTAIVAIVLWRTYAAGQSNVELAAKLKKLDDIRTKVKVDEEIRNMSADDRRKQLDKWVRN